MSEAAVIGLQGDTLADAGSIAACAKHFIGDGGTTGGIDQGNTEIDEASRQPTAVCCNYLKNSLYI